MSGRTIALLIGGVLLLHLLVGLALFSQDSVDFFPKRRELQIAEEAAARRPRPPEPNFSVSERSAVDAATGERVRVTEYTVSTELHRGGGEGSGAVVP